MENKNSYFEMTLIPPSAVFGKEEIATMQSKMEDLAEPILTKMGASSETYIIRESNQLRGLKILFKTKDRRRLSFLRNIIKKHLPLREELETNYGPKVSESLYQIKTFISVGTTEGLSQKQFVEKLYQYKSNQSLFIKGEGTKYEGNDLEILNDKKNWRKWQKKLYDLIYNDFKIIKDASDREIIFILDKEGCTGKSKLTKYLLTQDPENVGVISEGSSAQLKSSLINIGIKKLYLIDLARTPAETGFNGLANTLENLKNGMVLSSFYGLGGSMLLPPPPPWIVVFANRLPESS